MDFHNICAKGAKLKTENVHNAEVKTNNVNALDNHATVMYNESVERRR